MDTIAPSRAVDDEVRFAEYVAILRRRKWLILGFVVACAVIGAMAGLLLPKKYSAAIVIAPVTRTSEGGQLGGLSGLASQFGGLASLAGISVGQDTRRAETLAVLTSAALTERYIAENDLLPTLYPRRWDGQAKRWRVSDPAKVPTLWKANRYFDQKIRSLSDNSKSGLVTMTITWTDPQEAARWANGLVKMTNDYLRARAISEAQRNIDYLNQQAAKTDVIPVKEAIGRLLESEYNKEMLARGTKEYALRVLDPAQPPETPSSLTPWEMTLVGLLGGLGISFLLAFFRVAWGRAAVR